MSLKGVIVFVLIICSLVFGLAVELMIAGLDIVYWTFANRGAWLLLWTAIAFVCILIVNWRNIMMLNREEEEKDV